MDLTTSWPGLLVIFLTFVFAGSSVEGSHANYSLDINSLDKLADSDLRVVQSVLGLKKELGKDSRLHKIIDKQDPIRIRTLMKR